MRRNYLGVRDVLIYNINDYKKHDGRLKGDFGVV